MGIGIATCRLLMLTATAQIELLTKPPAHLATPTLGCLRGRPTQCNCLGNESTRVSIWLPGAAIFTLRPIWGFQGTSTTAEADRQYGRAASLKTTSMWDDACLPPGAQ
eukprot:2900423-Pyramimonas_sp.AAC.1